MKKLLMIFLILFLMASCDFYKTEDATSNFELKEEQNQVSNGDHVITSFANGNPKVVKTFEVKGNKLIAVYEKEYYEDGTLFKEGKLKNEKREGFWKSYRPNGILWSEGNFKNGHRNGVTTTYHPNGNIYYLGEYTNGSKSGNWKFYNNEGKLVKEENFDK